MFVYNDGRTVKNLVIVLSCLVIPFSLWALLALDFPRIYKHANFKVQKSPSQLRFSLPSIIITITSNEL